MSSDFVLLLLNVDDLRLGNNVYAKMEHFLDAGLSEFS